MFCCIHARDQPGKLQECAGKFSPEAELTDGHTIVFDVSRLHRLYGSAHEIAQAIARHALAPRRYPLTTAPTCSAL